MSAGIEIAGNLERIRQRIGRSARRAGRDPAEVALVGATKGVPASRIQEAVSAGLKEVGENYLQEARPKFLEIGRAVRWHFIGHLQTNKVKPALGIFDLIQSVDSVGLAREIDRRSQAAGRVTPVLLEVNVSGEPTKHGAAPEDLPALASACSEMAGLRVEGLMTIGALVEDPELARPGFRLMARLYRQLAGALPLRWLSMGMTHDFEAAIEEGANMVRIGTGIFGPRS